VTVDRSGESFLRAPRGLAVPAFAIVGAVLVVWRLLGLSPWVHPNLDFHVYWATGEGIRYAVASPFTIGSYLYSPAFAQAIGPLTVLPWPAFAGVWTAILMVTLGWLAGRWALAALLMPPVALGIYLGQIDLLIGAAIVLGFRYPAAWALPLLTKVSPGVGLVWFLVRREWGALWIAFAATVGIVAISAAADPASWAGWVELLRRSGGSPPVTGLDYLPVPLLLRMPIAIALVAWGARTNRRWTVAVAAALAMPILWLNTIAVVVAALPLLGHGPAARVALSPTPQFGRGMGVRLAGGPLSRIARALGLRPPVREGAPNTETMGRR